MNGFNLFCLDNFVLKMQFYNIGGLCMDYSPLQVPSLFLCVPSQLVLLDSVISANVKYSDED